ncbi:MAG: hypothetical protein PHE78_04565, partial [Candidatus Gastranaerophilales bacterium]|nr:hypothetical protein [Candidatus Gastranaerophilales bacterium]
VRQDLIDKGAIFQTGMDTENLIHLIAKNTKDHPESESKDVLDNFVEIMQNIATEVKENPELVLEAPHTTPVLKIDETLAARQPNLRYQ